MSTESRASEEEKFEADMALVEHGFRRGFEEGAAYAMRVLEERRARLLAVAARGELRGWNGDHWAERIDLLSSLIYEVKGSPGRGMSMAWQLDYLQVPGHRTEIVGVPAWGPVRFEARCSCARGFLGWSVQLVGAKRLIRKHVEGL